MFTPEQLKELREAYIDVMLGGNSRWVTYEDMKTNEGGEFVGYMAESLWSDVFLPLLELSLPIMENK